MEAKVIVTTAQELKTIIASEVANAIDAAFRYHQPRADTFADKENSLYGDFNWLCTTCSGVPRSTLRVKSAAGEIPGVIKFGKRVLYQKADVLNWLRSQAQKGGVTA